MHAIIGIQKIAALCIIASVNIAPSRRGNVEGLPVIFRVSAFSRNLPASASFGFPQRVLVGVQGSTKMESRAR